MSLWTEWTYVGDLISTSFSHLLGIHGVFFGRFCFFVFKYSVFFVFFFFDVFFWEWGLCFGYLLSSNELFVSSVFGRWVFCFVIVMFWLGPQQIGGCQYLILLVLAFAPYSELCTTEENLRRRLKKTQIACPSPLRGAKERE